MMNTRGQSAATAPLVPGTSVPLHLLLEAIASSGIDGVESIFHDLTPLRAADGLREAARLLRGEPALAGEALLPFVPPVAIELGHGLAEPVMTSESARARFDEMISLVRHGMFEETGVLLPGFRIRTLGSGYPPRTYVVKVFEVPVMTRTVPRDQCLTNAPGHWLEERNVPATAELMGPLVFHWVERGLSEALEADGFRTWQDGDCVILALSWELRRHLHRFLGIQEVRGIISQLSGAFPDLVAEVVPQRLAIGELRDVLQCLARERISIRDMRAVLEALVSVPPGLEPGVLAETVRAALRDRITYSIISSTPDPGALVISQELEEVLRGAVVTDPDGAKSLQLSPAMRDQFQRGLAKAMAAVPANRTPLILAPAAIRRFLPALIEELGAEAMIVSPRDLLPTFKLTTLAEIDLESLPAVEPAAAGE